MSSRFSVPDLSLPARPTAARELGVGAWARALPLHAGLALGGAIAGVGAVTDGSVWLGAVASLALTVVARLVRAVRAVSPDAPLAAALVRGRRAHVLELSASESGWRPTVLDARVLARRGLGPCTLPAR